MNKDVFISHSSKDEENEMTPEKKGPLSNEVGQIGRYSFLQNEKGEIMLVMDSREGDPEDSRFIYDGTDTALLYRSLESSLVFRKIDEDACEPLKTAKEIYVVEVEDDDVKRDYKVPVRLVQNVENLIL